ncbi:LexA family transcriptional regulator [Hymenobacter profundi]|uniref:LexA family transcriptional regulator n=1 Tax=Hymenobacter profundi TaxID=1982110 RepID=A0ABS6WZ41_9BACT|nr:LexA family transcriptional regulator [Hymenobacter profundi]MBW3128862.1 LexA family transcriptional regulator [Hymenobacter profundi]
MIGTTASLIKSFRIQAALTQEQLGNKVGVTKASISAYEKGKAQPSDHVLSLLAKEFDLSIDSLRGGILGDTRYNTAPLLRKVVPFGTVELTFISVPARATFAEVGASKADFDQFGTIAVPIMPGESPEQLEKCVVFEVNGDSMEPTLNHGQRIVAEPVNEADWEYQSDRVFVVSYAGYLVIKRIKTNLLRQKSYLELWSDNEKKGGVKTAQRSEIRGIWKVLRLDRAPDIY